jgi:hypothetical protein
MSFVHPCTYVRSFAVLSESPSLESLLRQQQQQRKGRGGGRGGKARRKVKSRQQEVE